MVTERKIIADVVNRYLLKEYVMKATERSGFGGIDIQRNPMGTLVTLVAERPGMVIGHRGKTIKELTMVMETKFKFDNPQIEVEEERKPNLNANIMAHKLAVALERGWHFRRAGHSTVRKIMGSGARGCQVVLAGKITGERHRTEKFKEGHIKYCGECALQTMEIGYAVAKKKLGTIGIKVMIMRPDAVLPDEIKILTQEQAKGIVPEAIVEELKIDTSIGEDEEPVVLDDAADDEADDDAAELVEALIKEGQAVASAKEAAAAVTPAEPQTGEIEVYASEGDLKSAPDVPVSKEADAEAEPEVKKAKAKKAPAKKPKAKAKPEAKEADTDAEAEPEVKKAKAKKAPAKKAPAKKTKAKAEPEVKEADVKAEPATKDAVEEPEPVVKKAKAKKAPAKKTTKKTAEKKTTAKTAKKVSEDGKEEEPAKKTTKKAAKKAAAKKPAAKKPEGKKDTEEPTPEADPKEGDAEEGNDAI